MEKMEVGIWGEGDVSCGEWRVVSMEGWRLGESGTV